MRSYTTMILVIVGIILSAAITGIFFNTKESITGQSITAESQEPIISSIAVDNINNERARTIQIEIIGGSEPVAVNDTLITIQTQQATGSYKIS